MYLAREGSAAAAPYAIPEERRLAVLLVFHLGQLHLPLAHFAVTAAPHYTKYHRQTPAVAVACGAAGCLLYASQKSVPHHDQDLQASETQ
jgi:hypothetical protein